MSKISIKVKCYTMLAILMIALALMFFMFLNTSAQAVKGSKRTQVEIQLSRNISELIHNLQIERGLSAATASGNAELASRLPAQRLISDEKLKTLKKEIREMKFSYDVDFLKDSMNALEQLENQRSKVNPKNVNEYKEKQLNAGELISYYSQTIAKLITAINKIANEAVSTDMMNDLQAYAVFIGIKEQMGIQRATGNVVIEHAHPSSDIIANYTNSKSRVMMMAKIFNDVANDDFKGFYNTAINSDEAKIADEMAAKIEQKALQGIPTDFSAPKWFSAISSKINEMYVAEKQIASKINVKVAQSIKTEDSKFNCYLAGGLTLFVVILLFTIYMMRDMHKSINHIKNELAIICENKDLTKLIELKNKDEISVLASSVNDFTSFVKSSLSSMSKDINANVAVSKELTQISHELDESINHIRQAQEKNLRDALNSKEILKELKNSKHEEELLNKLSKNIELIEKLSKNNINKLDDLIKSNAGIRTISGDFEHRCNDLGSTIRQFKL